MARLRRFVLLGPRPRKTKEHVLQTTADNKQQSETDNGTTEQRPVTKAKHETPNNVGGKEKRKSVTFDLTPQVFTLPTETPVHSTCANMSSLMDSTLPNGYIDMQNHGALSNGSDTIAVAEAKASDPPANEADDDDSPLSDLAQLEAEIDAEYIDTAHGPRQERKDTETGMVDAVESGDEVDEGSVDYAEHITPEPDNLDAESVITVSSTEDRKDHTDHPAGIFGMPEHPWKSKSFDREVRLAFEFMYCDVNEKQLGGSWDYTEEYMRAKDEEMLQYVKDYPIDSWIIPKKRAEQAWFRLLERTRWRGLGISIYGNQRIPEMVPNATPSAHAMASANQPPMHHAHMAGHPPPYHLQQTHGLSQAHPHQHGVHHSHGPDHHVLQNHHHASIGGPHGGHMPPGMPYTMANATLPFHPPPQGPKPPTRPAPVASSSSRNVKIKRDTPPAQEPTGPPPTPPYTPLERPSDKTKTTKYGKRNMRRQAEAEEYPWHRQFDFKKARDEASWDMSDYDQAVLVEMARTRALNGPYIKEQDDILNVKQRESRNNRKKGIKKTSSEGGAADSGDDDGELKAESPAGKRKKNENVGGDPYHSGDFCFASQTDVQKAMVLQKSTPNEIIAEAEAGNIDWNLCKGIFVTWNASKKGQTEQLEQGRFRIYDTLITRQQLRKTLILTREAAECIVDFCPDLLWRETLLRMASEAGFGNKDIRDRFCYNGCWADKATFTKRIAGALGQKQNNSARMKKSAGGDADEDAEGDSIALDEELLNMKRKGRGSAPPKDLAKRYSEEEYRWYQKNDLDYFNYIAFFGKRTGHRNLSHVTRADKKRKADNTGDDSVEPGPSIKRTKSQIDDSVNSAVHEDTVNKMGTEKTDAEDDQMNGDVDKDEDAVSVQDSDILDEMSD